MYFYFRRRELLSQNGDQRRELLSQNGDFQKSKVYEKLEDKCLTHIHKTVLKTMPLKATMSYHYPSIKMSKLKSLTIPSTRENTSNWNSHLLLTEMQNMEHSLAVSENDEHPPYDPAISLPSVSPRKIKVCVYIKICIQIFVFIYNSPKLGKNIKYSSINIVWYIHTTE